MTSSEGRAASTRRPTLARGGAGLATGAGLAVLGLVTAPVAALVSRMVWRSALVTVPYGLALSAAGSMAVVLLARAVSRRHALVAAAGWLVGLGFVVNGTSGGSFVVASDGLGWSFLVLSTLAAVAAAVWGSARL
jgi:hypothetical protein